MRSRFLIALRSAVVGRAVPRKRPTLTMQLSAASAPGYAPSRAGRRWVVIRRHPATVWAAGAAIGLIGCALLYRTQLSSGFDRFPGPHGDTRLIAYLVEHWYRSISGRSSLLSPPMFYPVKGTLGYSDLLVAFVPPYSLLRVVGLNIFSALSFTVILFNYLGYLACFFLLRRTVRLGLVGASAGAAFFAFNNPKLAQPDHLQLQASFLLPLAVVFALEFMRRVGRIGEWRAFALLAAAALCVALELGTSFYLGFFFVFWLVVLVLVALLSPRSRRFCVDIARSHWRALLSAGAVFLAALAPLLIIYVPVAWSLGGQPYEVVTDYLPQPRSYLLMGDYNYVWSGLTAKLLGNGAPDWGRRIGVGLIPSATWLLLTVLAMRILVGRRRAKAGNRRGAFAGDAWLLAALTIAAVDIVILLAMQYGDHSPWRYVYEFAPGAKSIRAVARFSIFLALPMAIVFGFGLDRATVRLGRIAGRAKRVLLLGLAAVIVLVGLFEQFNHNGVRDSWSIRAENQHLRMLARQLPTGCSAFYLALAPGKPHRRSRLDYQQDAMFVSLLRGVPTINGRSGKYPKGWPLYRLDSDDFDRRADQWIRRNHIDGVVCRLEVSY